MFRRELWDCNGVFTDGSSSEINLQLSNPARDTTSKGAALAQFKMLAVPRARLLGGETTRFTGELGEQQKPDPCRFAVRETES